MAFIVDLDDEILKHCQFPEEFQFEVPEIAKKIAKKYHIISVLEDVIEEGGDYVVDRAQDVGYFVYNEAYLLTMRMARIFKEELRNMFINDEEDNENTSSKKTIQCQVCVRQYDFHYYDREAVGRAIQTRAVKKLAERMGNVYYSDERHDDIVNNYDVDGTEWLYEDTSDSNSCGAEVWNLLDHVLIKYSEKKLTPGISFIDKVKYFLAPIEPMSPFESWRIFYADEGDFYLSDCNKV